MLLHVFLRVLSYLKSKLYHFNKYIVVVACNRSIGFMTCHSISCSGLSAATANNSNGNGNNNRETTFYCHSNGPSIYLRTFKAVLRIAPEKITVFFFLCCCNMDMGHYNSTRQSRLSRTAVSIYCWSYRPYLFHIISQQHITTITTTVRNLKALTTIFSYCYKQATELW